MAKFIDFLLCTLSTLCMFAVPMALLGLAPWMAEHILHAVHLSSYTGFVASLEVVMLMLASSAGVILLVIPLFAGALYLLTLWVRKNDAASERQEVRDASRQLGGVEQAIGRFNKPETTRSATAPGPAQNRVGIAVHPNSAAPAASGAGISQRLKAEKAQAEQTPAERLAAARLSKLAGR